MISRNNNDISTAKRDHNVTIAKPFDSKAKQNFDEKFQIDLPLIIDDVSVFILKIQCKQLTWRKSGGCGRIIRISNCPQPQMFLSDHCADLNREID